MTEPRGYGRRYAGQWRMHEGAQPVLIQLSGIRRAIPLPSRIVDDGWWLVAGSIGDVVEPRRTLKHGAETTSPDTLLQGRATWTHQRRST